MDTKGITMLKDLSATLEDVLLKVRLIRMWRLPNTNFPDQDYSIEMILIDEQGTRIRGSCLKKWFFRFEQYLEDNVCLFIKKPSLGIELAKNKFVDNHYKVNLNYQTHISKCFDFDGPEYGFQFSSFASILDRAAPESFTLDLIGHVTKIFPEKDPNEKKKMTMQIEDLEGTQVKLTLWDTYFRQLEKYISENTSEDHVVLILQFGRVKWFNDVPYVQNCFGKNVSRLFINNDIEDIRKYKKSLMKRAADTPSSNNPPLSLSMGCSIEDEFLVNFPFTSIFEICEIIEVKKVVIVGTIKAIVHDAGWMYDGCKKCHYKPVHKWMPRLKPDGSEDLEGETVDYCKKCDARIVATVPKLKIQIRVQDVTGFVSLTLFERHLTKLVQTTAVVLLEEKQKAEDDVLYFPKVFNSLLEKKFAFMIEVGVYNLKNNYPVYGVLKLTDQPSIISELEKKLDNLQPNEFESGNMSLSEIPSQDTVANKAPLSYIGDNETPLSTVKRKLVDVYDLEESSTMSAVKTTNFDVNDKGDLDEKLKLLTPKLEK